tara:strand:- start:114 stop:332 length:219 start_codon:yes stop_codon:yes gene_type:complete
MGRMKELYMRMLEEQQYGAHLAKHVPKEPTKMDITCPNCMNDKLMFNSTADIKCHGCGHEFVLVDANTVRFK